MDISAKTNEENCAETMKMEHRGIMAEKTPRRLYNNGTFNSKAIQKR